MPIIEVNFEDDSKKKFVVTQDTTVNELVEKILQKLYVKTDCESFGLYYSFGKGSCRLGIYFMNYLVSRSLFEKGK
jgi:hypothetical protein